VLAGHAHVLIGGTLQTLALAAHVTFNFTFLTRVHELSGTQAATIIGLLTGVVGSYAYAGAIHAVAQSLAKPRMRAMAAAIMLFSMNLLGYGLGPPLAGLISDLLGGEGALRYSLALMNAVLIWSCAHYLLAARTYREDRLERLSER
jgi:MFS family permease